MTEPNVWHRPQPGPLYWDFRCLRCGENVDAHPPLWRLIWRRIRGGSDV